MVSPQGGPRHHAKVGHSLYSITWRHIGRHLDARVSTTTVEFFLDGALVKTHARKPRGKQTDWADYPPEKVAFFMRTPAWCRHRAAEIGPSCEALIAELLELNVLYRLRTERHVGSYAKRHIRTYPVVHRQLGSNVFNSTALAGTAALIGPGAITDAGVSVVAVMSMVAIAALAWLFLGLGGRLSRLGAVS